MEIPSTPLPQPAPVEKSPSEAKRAAAPRLPYTPLDHRALYRLPWSFSDNVIAWLEPTTKCNLACAGCYRQNVDHHKTLAEVDADLDTFARYRTFDGVSIAGGDPLLHPDVVEIVASVAGRGWKPVINTNGLALKPDLLAELKHAGLVGITFHVDSKQGRPGWRRASEVDLCDLRLQFAEMAQRQGVSCTFNSTVYEDTLAEVPDLVAWAQRHIDKVHNMVFIAYREATLAEYDYFAGGERVAADRLQYVVGAERQRTDITSSEIVATIRTRFPDFAPAAYLGGTEAPDSMKWLMAGRVGTAERIHGYVGPRSMEAIQAAHHLATGRYLAYTPPSLMAHGRATMGAFAALDPGMRGALGRYLGWAARNPLRLAARQYYQSITCIQPIDILPDGRQNMCDGCPDMTAKDGKLLWSCRLEEHNQFGCFLHTAARGCPADKPRPLA